MFREASVLLHNTRPHTAVATQELLDQFRCDILDHPPYSSDLAPNRASCSGFAVPDKNGKCHPSPQSKINK
ncbi:hypothetical protein TNCV_1411701 [Trichonephila clavipes]|nr:hypothetical protein TNCV_1411701 [Trichonephila clavipes]